MAPETRSNHTGKSNTTNQTMQMGSMSNVLSEIAPPPTTSSIHTTSPVTSFSTSPSNVPAKQGTAATTTITNPIHTSSGNLQTNRFGALLDDDGGNLTATTTAVSTQHATSSIFQQPTFSGSAATYASSLVRINKPQLLTTSLGDMSELTGALDQAKTSRGDVTEAERQGNASRNWDLSNLHTATTNLIPKEHRHNDFLGRSEAEHQKDLNKLQEGLLQSKRFMSRLQGKKKKKEYSKTKNARKNKKKAKGQAHAERMAAKAGGRGSTGRTKQGSGGGRQKKNRGKNRRGNPY
jgi:hypothetical protein